MPPTAFVTGTTGFLGSHLASTLRARGWNVRGLVRTTSGTDRLRALGVEPIPGTLGDAEALARGSRGADVVFHSAAVVGDRVRWDEARATNVAGTEAMLNAAASAGVGRFVHVSSVLVYGFDAGAYDESSPRRLVGDPYADTKSLAEDLCDRTRAEGAMAVDVLRPGVIHGPGDRGMIPKLVTMLRDRALPSIGDGSSPVGLVFVDDVVEAAIALAERGTDRGAAYNLVGPGDLSWAGLVERLVALCGVPAPSRRIPRAFAMSLAWSVEAAVKLSIVREPAPLTRNAVKFLTEPRAYSVEKLARELRFAPRVPALEGLARTFGAAIAA